MKLEVIHRTQTQTIGLLENVCLAVRWSAISTDDVESYRRALALVHERFPGGIAFLQVNRFDPIQTTRVDEAITMAMFKLFNSHVPALRILALAMPNAPMVSAGLRGQWSRIALAMKSRLNYQVFDELGQATTAVCETLKAPGLPTQHPSELEAAVEKLAKERLPAR